MEVMVMMARSSLCWVRLGDTLIERGLDTHRILDIAVSLFSQCLMIVVLILPLSNFAVMLSLPGINTQH